ncbi:MAG TPA: HAD-IIB family hydrolase [Clostridia bacterium]|nr:HAD-IIB family hydrolase [Clostridia bacterium]
MRTLYLSDLDGTLLRSDETIGPYTAGVIREMAKREIPFSYATARSFLTARRVTGELTVSLPAIVYNGVMIVRQPDGAVLSALRFTQSQTRALAAMLRDLGAAPLVYATLEGRQRVSWLQGGENEGMRHYLNKRSSDPRLRPVDSEADVYAGEVFYLTCIGEQSDMARVQAAASAHPYVRTVFQQELYRPEYWCELMPGEASKAQAALRLKALLNCDRIVAFGDAINDLPLFEAADECYAVGNAVPELKARATGILADNDAEGVAAWLAQHVLGHS